MASSDEGACKEVEMSNEKTVLLNDDDNDEESRLRARLLAKKAELMREKEVTLSSILSSKKSDKEKHHHHHHHKKKKKRHSSGSPQEKGRKGDELVVSKLNDFEKKSRNNDKILTQVEATKFSSTPSRRVFEIEPISMQNVINAKIVERLSVTLSVHEDSSAISQDGAPYGEGTNKSEPDDYVRSSTKKSERSVHNVLKADEASNEKSTAAATNIGMSFEEELESLGPNIQPPQAFSLKKFKKRDKKRPEEDERPSRAKRMHLEEVSRGSKQSLGDERGKSDKRVVESGTYGISTIAPGSLQSHGKYVPYQDFGSRSQFQQVEDSKIRQEKMSKTYSDQDFRYRQQREVEKPAFQERRKPAFTDKYQRDTVRHFRADERRRKSRSPSDRRDQGTVSGIHRSKRSFSPIDKHKRRSRSRENRWLPKITGRGSSPTTETQQRYSKHVNALPSSLDHSRDRSSTRPSRSEFLYGPPPPSSVGAQSSKSPSPLAGVSDVERKVVQPSTSTIEIAQTPTLDEEDDQNIVVPKSEGNKFDSSPVSSAASATHTPDRDDKNAGADESLESGEHRSENDERKKAEKASVLESEELSLPVYFPATQGCRSVEEFQNMNKIEKGTYGVVYRAVEKRTGEIVALKRLKMEKEKEGFPIQALREINMLLKAGQHRNIVKVREIVVGSNMDKIYLVMDYVEHDLKSLMETSEIKTLLLQLLAGIDYLHDNWILHRDLKTSNLLLSHKGVLQVLDLRPQQTHNSIASIEG